MSFFVELKVGNTFASYMCLNNLTTTLFGLSTNIMTTTIIIITITMMTMMLITIIIVIIMIIIILK